MAAPKLRQNFPKFGLRFGAAILFQDEFEKLKFSQSDVLMGRSFSQNFRLLTQIGQKLKISTLDGTYSL